MSTLILGLDPGLVHTGWGILSIQDSALSYKAHGRISVPSSLALAERLKRLYKGLQDVIHHYKPHEAAVEEVFVNKNPTSTLKLGLARGVILLAPARQDIPVFEYTANHVKKSVVGYGHADKQQVASMVHRLLPCSEKALQDAADALAVAICHAYKREFQQKIINF